ncbi:MAG: hypothetical protein KatS3mg032_1624 [Cyclobacteriaceae bacterium]|nr:MAG: hypothetical protein KatS3mg032_1624 [Cyclobacteriaceae bacterium]
MEQIKPFTGKSTLPATIAAHYLQNGVFMAKKPAMKAIFCAVVALILTAGCGTIPKPYYETRVGKKKQKYYNAIQFGQRDIPPFPKTKTSRPRSR